MSNHWVALQNCHDHRADPALLAGLMNAVRSALRGERHTAEGRPEMR
jgi:hypothetical protein